MVVCFFSVHLRECSDEAPREWRHVRDYANAVSKFLMLADFVCVFETALRAVQHVCFTRSITDALTVVGGWIGPWCRSACTTFVASSYGVLHSSEY